VSNEVYIYLISEVKRLWHEKQIPEYHQETFLKAVNCCSREFSAPMIAKEIETLKKNESQIQVLTKSILAREECILEIIDIDKKIGEAVSSQKFDQDGGLLVDGFDMEEQLMQTMIDQVNALRMLSLNAVDQIVKWREQILFAYTAMKIEQTVQFLFQNENYLRKM